jgi:hypothetical protein
MYQTIPPLRKNNRTKSLKIDSLDNKFSLFQIQSKDGDIFEFNSRFIIPARHNKL